MVRKEKQWWVINWLPFVKSLSPQKWVEDLWKVVALRMMYCLFPRPDCFPLMLGQDNYFKNELVIFCANIKKKKSDRVLWSFVGTIIRISTFLNPFNFMYGLPIFFLHMMEGCTCTYVLEVPWIALHLADRMVGTVGTVSMCNHLVW